MADRVTQIQDTLDQLATQFYASLRYVLTHHSASPIASQPTQPQAQTAANGDSSSTATGPVPPAVFMSALTELSRDLIIKEQQIEYLISVLPGIGSSSAAQEARLLELEGQLKVAEKERAEAAKERDRLVERVEKAILGIRKI